MNQTGKRVLVAALCLVPIWALVVVYAARVYVPAHPGAEPGEPLSAQPEELILAQGRGSSDGGRLAIEAFTADGAALFLWRPEPFDAAALPVLRMNLENVPFNYVLMLAWTTNGASQPSFTRLQIPTGSTRTIHLARFEQWRGRVVEMAFYLYPQQQTSPPAELSDSIVVRELGVYPDGLGNRVAALASEWFAPLPWELMTISSIGVYRDLKSSSYLLPVIAILCLTAILVVGLVFRFAGLRQWTMAVVVVAVIGTLVLNAHWLWSFASQRAATDVVYAGLEPDRKQDLLFDADLVRIVRNAGARLPEPGAARIFVSADDRFFRLRSAWHLRPHNVMSFLPGVDIRGVRAIRNGDYLFLYRTPELIDQASRGHVTLGKRRLAVRLLYREGAGALFRVGESG